MSFSKKIQEIIKKLKKEKIDFAFAGGFVASIYRESKRTTDDLDILIYTESKVDTAAKKILSSMNYYISEVRIADVEGGPKFAIKSNSTPTCIIIGRKDGEIGIDFILPSMKWSKDALERAKHNEIDFGFAKIPCLTVEDLLLAKFYALKNQSTRFQDADDIKSIFEKDQDIDLSYICGQMQRLEIQVPLSVEKLVPKILVKTSKSVLKSIRNRNV